MRAAVVSLTLKDLRQAVIDYCSKLTPEPPDTVIVESYDKPVIEIEVFEGGSVCATEFTHKHHA